MLKLFKKKGSEPDQDAYVEDLLDEIDELEQRLARLQKDFSDYKKRQGRLIKTHEDSTISNVIEEFLGVKESLEMAVESRGKRDLGEMMKGIRQISKQMDQTLRNLGVKIIDPKNEPFDPEYHEALKRTVIKTLPDETVVRVFTKGYVYKGKVIRPARVAVSTGGVRRGHVPQDEVDWEREGPGRAGRGGGGRPRRR